MKERIIKLIQNGNIEELKDTFFFLEKKEITSLKDLFHELKEILNEWREENKKLISRNQRKRQEIEALQKEREEYQTLYINSTNREESAKYRGLIEEIKERISGIEIKREEKDDHLECKKASFYSIYSGEGKINNLARLISGITELIKERL